MREVRIKMAKAVAKPIALRAGRWSIHPRSKGNFVYSFDGCIPFNILQSYERLLLEPFYGSGQLCPSMGWTRFAVHGVPAWDDDGLTIFGPDAILEEARTMPGLKKATFAMQPRWLKQPEEINTNYSTITFAVSDLDGAITNTLLNNRAALFGKEVTVRRWIDKPALVQCSRCHALGHNKAAKACPLDKDSVKCHICSGAHISEKHNQKCNRNHTVAGICDCKHFKCLNCHMPGHNCRDARCPARDLYRPRGGKNKGKAKAPGPATVDPPDLDGDLYGPASPAPALPAGRSARPPHPRSPSLTRTDIDRIAEQERMEWDHPDQEWDQETGTIFEPGWGYGTAQYAPPLAEYAPLPAAPPVDITTAPPTSSALAHADPLPEHNMNEQVAIYKAYSPSHSIGVANQMNHT